MMMMVLFLEFFTDSSVPRIISVMYITFNYANTNQNNMHMPTLLFIHVPISRGRALEGSSVEAGQKRWSRNSIDVLLRAPHHTRFAQK